VSDDNIVSLSDKLRSKAVSTELRRMLARTVREMKGTGATYTEIADALREAAEDLDDDGKKPA
jgi:hypothetical protein